MNLSPAFSVRALWFWNLGLVVKGVAFSRAEEAGFEVQTPRSERHFEVEPPVKQTRGGALRHG
jgi:hypothetical protein